MSIDNKCDIQNDQTLNDLWSRFLIDLLTELGLKHFIISPGLRNAPIIRAIKSNGKAKSNIIIDERSASYLALASAKLGGAPCALVCTSGTAYLNYFSAIMEANYSSTPLIVLSADRPKKLVNLGDNQCIDQISPGLNIFEKVLDFDFSNEKQSQKYWTEFIGQNYQRICLQNKKSLQINIPFTAPLEASSTLEDGEIKLTQTSLRNTFTFPFKEDLKASIVNQVKGHLGPAKRPILIIGNNTYLHRKNISLPNIPQYIDPSCHYKFIFSSKRIPSPDHPEVFSKLVAYDPDLIIQIGEKFVSKKLSLFLKQTNTSKRTHIHFTESKEINDPAESITHKYIVDMESALNLLSEINFNTNAIFKNGELSKIIELKSKIIDQNDISIPFVTKNLLPLLPKKANLFFGNSTFIRSVDCYFHHSENKDWQILTNRGVSGIEGHIAMAMGMSTYRPEVPCFSFMGDISFMHDLSSLANFTSNSFNQLTFIVINNYGGRIFSLLPIKEDPSYPVISTPHNLNFELIAKQFNLNYLKVDSTIDFTNCIQDFLCFKGPKFLEISINDEVNSKVYKQLNTIKD